MKKHRMRNTVIVLVIILIGISLSADLTLRTAVFLKSPVSAFTMEYTELKSQETSFGTKYGITENAPVERATQGTLYTWIVYEFGPFHYAHYYGEG